MAFIGKESVTVTSLDSAESMSVVTDLTVDTNTLKVDSTSNRVGILNATPAVSLDIGSATDAIHIPVGTTGERPGAPASGLFRYNTTLNQFEGYTSTWGAIGGGGTNTFTHDSFTGDDTTTDFVLSQATESENNLFVFIDGVFQTQDAYSIATNSGVTTLTLSAAPVLNRKIIVYTVAAGVSGNNLNQNLFDANTTDAVDGINTAFTLSIPPVNKNNTQVFFDGVYQHKANYSISGSVLTFTDAPPLGVIVEVMIFTQTAVNVPVDNSVTSAKLSGDLVAPGNLTVTGYLAGPATFIIDPAGVGDNTGTLLVKGDLQVDGTQTIINSTTLTVDDLNITVASGAANALAADGAGITVDTGTDPDATITYDGVNDEWDFNKNVNVTGSVTADGLTVANTSVIAGDFDGGTAATYIRLQDDTDNFLFGSSNSLGSFVIKNETADAFRMSVANTGDVSFYEDTGTTPKFFWDASAEFLGIGTSAPQQVLQISQGASAGTTALRIENTETGIDPAQTANAIEFYTNDASAGGTGVTGKISHVAVNAGTTYALAFSTYNGTTLSESMRIDSSGNVGIGTSLPSERITLAQSVPSTYTAGLSTLANPAGTHVRIENNSSVTDTFVGATFVPTNGAEQQQLAYMGAVSTGSGLAPDIVFGRRAASTYYVESMRIDSNGNVGIGSGSPTNFLGGKVTEITNSGNAGTTADNQDLIVKSVNRFSAISVIGKNTGGSQLNFGDEDNREVGGFQYDHTSDYLITRVNGAEATRIDSNGRLLVGNSAAALTGASIESFGSANGVAGIGMRHTGATAGQWWRMYMQNDSKAIVTNASGTGVSLTYGGTSWVAVSDETLKENISDIGTVLDKVINYRCVNYSLKATESISDDKVGFIAQDWENDFPNVVVHDEGGELSMKYTETIPVLLKAIQEQQATIEALTARIAALEE